MKSSLFGIFIDFNEAHLVHFNDTAEESCSIASELIQSPNETTSAKEKQKRLTKYFDKVRKKIETHEASIYLYGTLQAKNLFLEYLSKKGALKDRLVVNETSTPLSTEALYNRVKKHHLHLLASKKTL